VTAVEVVDPVSVAAAVDAASYRHDQVEADGKHG